MPHFELFTDERYYEVKRFVAEYSFRLREISGIEIKVRIWETKDGYGGSHFTFDQSHYLHTPIQAGPYMTSAPFGDSEEDALFHALGTFQGYIPGAKAQGHEPNPKWLVENEDY